MKKRIVYLTDLYAKIGSYLKLYGDANVTSISTHCNHPKNLYYTLNVTDLDTDKERKIDIPYKEIDIDENKVSKKLFEQLCALYIQDTSCDQQLFCGCREEDCENYRTENCIRCLEAYMESIDLDKMIKKTLLNKMNNNI